MAFRVSSVRYVSMWTISRRLADIIAGYNQFGRFSFHLVHQYDPIANKTVGPESDLVVVSGKWNKATSIDSLNLCNILGAVFKFAPERNRLIPF